MKIEINGQKFDLSPTSKSFLEKYLERMNHFIKQNGVELEVYDDIEERIAEKFAEKLSDKKVKKIDDKVVVNIVNEIGEPSEILEELIDNDYEPKKEQAKNTFSFKKHFGPSDNPLTRNSQKGKLFGVCYGIGNKYNIDPLWIRLLFVFTIPLWGMPILLYIVLIFLLPNAAKFKGSDSGVISEVENLTDNFVTDVKKATDKIDVQKIKQKIGIKNKDIKEIKDDKVNGDEAPKNEEGEELKEELKEEVKIKNIGSTVLQQRAEIEMKKENRNIFVRFFIFIFVSIKALFVFIFYGLRYIIVFAFHFLRYVIAFALIVGTIPVLVALVFVSGITFTTFQFDSQILFSNVDLLLKIGIVGILSAVLFLIFGIFLKLLKSKTLSDGLMITGLLGIFGFAFVGGLGSFSTFNEYKNIYTKTETFEFEATEFKLKDLNLFGERDSLIVGLNRIDGIEFRESDDEKIRVEIDSIINSKSKLTSETIFEQLTPIEVVNENGYKFGIGDNTSFKTLVPYSFLRREVIVYIPKDVSIEFGIDRGHHRTNLMYIDDESGDTKYDYWNWSCYNKMIAYDEENEGFVCK